MARPRTSLPADPRSDRPAIRWGRLAAPTAAIFLVAAAQGTAFAQAATTDTPAAQVAPAAASPTVPNSTELQAVLLTAADLGPGFSTPTDTSTGDPSTVDGCQDLAPLLTGTPTPGQNQQGTDMQAGDNGPFVNEGLLAEDPSKLSADYARDSAALKSCTSLSITSDGTTLDFKLSPINFAPAAASTAVRMDGTIDGEETNGYLAVGNLGDVEVEYFFFQFDDGSSQLASYFFTKAMNKAQGTLGSSGNGSPGGGSSPGGPPTVTPSPAGPGTGGVSASTLFNGRIS